MKNGQLERKDEDTLKEIYKKLTVDGYLKEPLTVEEQVLIYGISKWIRENVEVDKAHRRNKVARDVEKVLKDKRFIEASNRREEQAVLQSMCWMAFIGCEYLEMQHRYKKNGMEKFLKFLKGRMEEIGEDEQYFKDVIEYYKSTYDLDVATIMGVKIG